jgi:hypothetical protein
MCVQGNVIGYIPVHGLNVLGQNVSVTKRIGTKRTGPKRITYKTYWLQKVSETKHIGRQNVSATKRISGQHVLADHRET